MTAVYCSLQPAVAVAGSLVHYDACARDVLQ